MVVEHPKIAEIIALLAELNDDMANKRDARFIHDSTEQARRLLLEIKREYR